MIKVDVIDRKIFLLGFEMPFVDSDWGFSRNLEAVLVGSDFICDFDLVNKNLPLFWKYSEFCSIKYFMVSLKGSAPKDWC